MEETTEIRKIIFTTAIILMILLSIVYLTYSQRVNTPQSEIYTSIMKLDEEVYGKTEFDSTNLDLKPILDKNVNKESNNVIYIEFNVGGSPENDTEEIIYDIALADLDIDCALLSPYLKWKLIKNNLELSTGSLDYKFDTIEKNRLVLTNIQQDLVKYNEDKSKYDHYEFYMWLSDSCQEDNILNCKGSESQTNLLGKKIIGKIEVELFGGNKTLLKRKPQETINQNTCSIE